METSLVILGVALRLTAFVACIACVSLVWYLDGIASRHWSPSIQVMKDHDRRGIQISLSIGAILTLLVALGLAK